MRDYSFLDKFCLHVDQVARTLFDNPKTTTRSYPATEITEQRLTAKQRRDAVGLMRINHAGEVCAQALYHGQSIISNNLAMQEKMQQAAIEEGDHLSWCRRRLDELGGHTSYLNPFWYTGSFIIGMTAGWIGDQWSLGFVAETEQQVVNHLKKHLCLLPMQDQKSHKILQEMQRDEAKHRDEAIQSGAALLPWIVKKWMALTSTIMVKATYWV